jgi:hypothetical protein
MLRTNTHTKITTTRRRDGSLGLSPERKLKRRGGRGFGFGGSLGGWGWQLWLMRLSLILRKSTSVLDSGFGKEEEEFDGCGSEIDGWSRRS